MRTLRNALPEIAADDTEALVGLVALSGLANPLLDTTHLGDGVTPAIVMNFETGTEGVRGGQRDLPILFSFFGHPSDDDRLGADGFSYLERLEKMRDRLKSILTFANLNAKSVDTAPLNPQWGDLADDGDGTKGIFLRLRFANAS